MLRLLLPQNPDLAALRAEYADEAAFVADAKRQIKDFINIIPSLGGYIIRYGATPRHNIYVGAVPSAPGS